MHFFVSCGLAYRSVALREIIAPDFWRYISWSPISGNVTKRNETQLRLLRVASRNVALSYPHSENKTEAIPKQNIYFKRPRMRNEMETNQLKQLLNVLKNVLECFRLTKNIQMLKQHPHVSAYQRLECDDTVGDLAYPIAMPLLRSRVHGNE